MKKRFLQEMGLTDSEVKVYLALLELGDATRSAIVHSAKITGSKVYDILQKLQDKGLVAIYIQNNVKHFKALNPKQLYSYLADKKRKILDTEKMLGNLIPELMVQFHASRQEQEVELFTGIKGLELFFRQQVEELKKGEICYVIGGTKGPQAYENTLIAFFQKIHLMREKKKIKTQMLYNINEKKLALESYPSKSFPHTEIRFIQHTSPVSIDLHRDKVLIIIFGKTISSIQITSQEVADSFMQYYKLLWKQGVR